MKKDSDNQPWGDGDYAPMKELRNLRQRSEAGRKLYPPAYSNVELTKEEWKLVRTQQPPAWLLAKLTTEGRGGMDKAKEKTGVGCLWYVLRSWLWVFGATILAGIYLGSGVLVAHFIGTGAAILLWYLISILLVGTVVIVTDYYGW